METQRSVSPGPPTEEKKEENLDENKKSPAQEQINMVLEKLDEIHSSIQAQMRALSENIERFLEEKTDANQVDYAERLFEIEDASADPSLGIDISDLNIGNDDLLYSA